MDDFHFEVIPYNLMRPEDLAKSVLLPEIIIEGLTYMLMVGESNEINHHSDVEECSEKIAQF